MATCFSLVSLLEKVSDLTNSRRLTGLRSGEPVAATVGLSVSRGWGVPMFFSSLDLFWTMGISVAGFSSDIPRNDKS